MTTSETARTRINAKRIIGEDEIVDALEGKNLFVSLNAEKLYHIRRGDISQDCLRSCVFTVDGKGGELFVRMALGVSNRPKVNLPAVVLSLEWLRVKKVFLLGATERSNALAVARLREQGFEVTGVDGFKSYNETLSAARLFAPDVTFIGMGSPKQENWAAMLSNDLPSSALICCGGAINTMSGIVDKCPPLLDRLYLEWAYRLLRSPARFRRLHRLLAVPSEIVRYRISAGDA